MDCYIFSQTVLHNYTPYPSYNYPEIPMLLVNLNCCYSEFFPSCLYLHTYTLLPFLRFFPCHSFYFIHLIIFPSFRLSVYFFCHTHIIPLFMDFTSHFRSSFTSLLLYIPTPSSNSSIIHIPFFFYHIRKKDSS